MNLSLVCSKLPEAMAGVSEQVSNEVDKSLAERGFPATKPEQQLLLKGQICAIIEPANAVYKLMSMCSLPDLRYRLDTDQIHSSDDPSLLQTAYEL